MGPPKTRRVKNFVKSKIRGGTGTGGGGENAKMNEQLAALGLKVVPVTGDGNCFFRAIADQLKGDEEEHDKYRQMVVDFLEEHNEDFQPFLEEEITFDEYCNNMRQDGTWAGHMELQATSLVTKCDICIHRVMFPRWQIMNFQSPGTRIVQLSYHGEEHYNSVRKMDDAGVGPPTLETIKVDENLVNDLPPAKDGIRIDAEKIKRVMSGAAYFDPVHTKEVLDEVHGNADAAVEYLIAERNGSEDSDSSGDLISFEDSETSNDGHLGTSPLKAPETSLLVSDGVGSGSSSGHDIRSAVSRTKNVLLHPAQAVSRNKKCPCGSKKKYKACCGAVHGKPGVTFLTSAQEGGSSNKLRKERTKAANTNTISVVDSSLEGSSDSKENDLGVLCI